MRILLIEDDRVIAEFVIKGLREIGFTVDDQVQALAARGPILESDFDSLFAKEFKLIGYKHQRRTLKYWNGQSHTSQGSSFFGAGAKEVKQCDRSEDSEYS